jgi:uncharacterized RDD family membrane protein YckC
MEDYQDRLRIATPEGVAVDLVLAGVGSRFTATLIDLTFKFAILAAVSVVSILAGTAGVAVGAILAFAVYFGYDVAFEVWSGGRTPGKRWTGLRVLREDGRAVDLLASAIRNVIRLVDGLPLMYLPAMVSIVVTRRNQRLGDLAAGTIVVREARRTAPVATGAAAAAGGVGAGAGQTGTFHGFGMPARAAEPSATGALDVSAVTPEDLAAVRSFLERRGELPLGARDDLARRIAGALAPRVGGAVRDLTPEQLLERVAAAKSRDR